MQLQLADRVLDLTRPCVMGVLNVTPDSFSDGGKFNQPDDALRQAERMIAEGATFIDVGGESTRPGADPVTEQEELDRVCPVVELLRQHFDVLISLDTSTPAVMREGVACGAALINDVRALTREGALEAAASLDVPVCLMHMIGTPKTMQDNPDYNDLVAEVKNYLVQRVDAAVAAGIPREKLMLDPGFGFGKTLAHNLTLLQQLEQFRVLGLPLLVGLSRKSMLGLLTGRPVEERMPASVAAAALAVSLGANIVRAHDVAATVDAIKVAAAMRNPALA